MSISISPTLPSSLSYSINVRYLWLLFLGLAKLFPSQNLDTYWDIYLEHSTLHSFTSFIFLLKRSSSNQPSSALPLLPHTASFSPSHCYLRLQYLLGYVYGLSSPQSKHSFCSSCSLLNSLHHDSAWHIYVEWTIEFKESVASAITRILYQRKSGVFQFWDKLLEVSQSCENVISLWSLSLMYYLIFLNDHR